MIGDMIAKIRTEQGMSKTELARITGINIGHLTHIEKGDRNPSHKALKNICNALKVPYQQLMYTYDKAINETQESYNVVNHISYNKILAIDSVKSFIDCPSNFPSASVAIKCPDDSMSPTYEKGEYVFVEFNSPLNNNDIGLFSLNGKILIRKFSFSKKSITLKSNKNSSENITVSNDDNFYIVGKILNK